MANSRANAYSVEPSATSGHGDASDEPGDRSGVHVAAVSVPRLHEAVPETMYPELHLG